MSQHQGSHSDGDLDRCPERDCPAALDRLAQAAPIIKKNLLEACIRTVGADGVILEAEAELLRAIADTLDCPIPPLGLAGRTGVAPVSNIF